MLKLYSKRNLAVDLHSNSFRRITRLTTNKNLIDPLRKYETLLVEENINELPKGFGLVLVKSGLKVATNHSDCDVVQLDSNLDYLADGDVIRFNPDNLAISVLYRRNANTNTFLLTERCNSYCLMCSQPPRDIDDSYLVDDVLDAIPLISRETYELGLSGGEPTLLGEDLFSIIRSIQRHLPNTSIHILSNGRTFSDEGLARRLAEIGHFDLMIGIPLYSDVSTIHDFIVQADHAFDETIKGILNLKKHGVKVEIRVVLHEKSYRRLPQLAEFIARNLLFVDHVAFMGLEIIGFTRANLDELWIDPIDYMEELDEAVNLLARTGIRVSLYNLQLCLLKKSLWPFAVKSISDWKNEYHEECATCEVIERCGGFFESAKYRCSENISAIKISQ